MTYKILTIFSCIALASCGFSPVYGTLGQDSAAAEVQLAQVSIGNIPDRDGQYLRNALIDRFYRDGRPVHPAYNLGVSAIVERLVDLDITRSSDATRAQLTLRTDIVLKDTATGEIVLKRSLKSISSYNILTEEYATRIAKKAARDNALDDLAAQIEQQLSLYFNR